MSRVPDKGSLSPGVFRQVDRVCQAFEAAWRDGGQPQMEDYVRHAQEPVRSALVRELVLLDLEYRQRCGEHPTADSYCARLPQDAGVVRAVFAEEGPPASGGTVRSEPLQVQLEVIAGPRRGDRFLLAGHETFVVGRSQQAHLQVARGDKYFSRVHFVVEVNPPCCRLCDTGSRNGTMVNGRRVDTVDLADGDLIQGGETVLRVSFLGGWPKRPKPGEARPEVPPPVPGDSAATGGMVPRFRATTGGEASAATRGESAAQEDLSGHIVVPGCQLVRELGRGGMGIVYLARRVSDGKSVAVKTIRPGVTASHHEMSQFLREARILEQLRHPKIVSFLASGEAGDSLFFVMDYVEGTNALQLLRHEGPLPIGRAVGLVCQALEALAYAHGQGFVHRDVKPSNLLVGLGDDCKLADFGLARAYQCSALSGLTMMGDVGGSIPYMPPEQITHYRDARPPADQYAAAATLYHLLTGRLIFDFGNASNQRKLAQILCEEPIPIRTRRPNIPSPLAAAIHQALSKEPEKRFPSVTHFAKAILDSIPRPTC